MFAKAPSSLTPLAEQTWRMCERVRITDWNTQYPATLWSGTICIVVGLRDDPKGHGVALYWQLNETRLFFFFWHLWRECFVVGGWVWWWWMKKHPHHVDSNRFPGITAVIFPPQWTMGLIPLNRRHRDGCISIYVPYNAPNVEFIPHSVMDSFTYTLSREKFPFL